MTQNFFSAAAFRGLHISALTLCSALRHLVFLICLVVLTSSHGLGNGPGMAVPQQQPGSSSGMQPEIISNLEGTVEVSFVIDAKGKVKILSMNATNEQLAQYVIKKLNKINLDKPGVDSGKIIKYRFVFKKQA